MKALLKKILHPDPKVDIVGFEDGLVAFRSRRTLPLCALTVRAKTPRGRVRARLDIQSYDPAQQLYRAKVEDGGQLLPERREDDRLDRVMRVVSHQLPGFTCTTEDISTGGCRIVVTSHLEVGTRLTLSLDLDDANLPAIVSQAEVCWCAQKVNDRFHAGVRFVDMGSAERGMLARFIESRRVTAL
ncbi:MAG: PilZ domain-containing protein [Candidatus Eremiobacteraeota bacterium]|nr:PilZ domain-containing protein [Candidatus Eremiobacteraeota bacterium]